MKRFFNATLVLTIGIILCSCNQHEIISENQEPEKAIDTKIPIDKARANLLKLLADLNSGETRSGKTFNKIIESEFSLPVGASSTRSGDEESEVHVFNFADNQGFAIMSGDERVPELIALADSGAIAEDDTVTNPGLADFLNGMDNVYTGISRDKIGELVNADMESDIPNGYNVYGEWQNIVYKENGLCSVKWGQRDPYNLYCPLKGEKRTLTGCVATAVAQLMTVYKWPESYNGYFFSWDDMTSLMSAVSLPIETRMSVATLMQQLGLKDNLNMDYGLDESGAKIENVKRTLSAFGYSSPGNLKDYDVTEIATEIENGYPVLLCGYSRKHQNKVLGIVINTEYKDGHAWLVHGILERKREVRHYDSRGHLLKTEWERVWYPLCNWGWRGYADGYYLSDAFDTKQGPVYSDMTRSDDDMSDDDISNQKKGYFQFKIRQITGIRK